MEWDEHRGRVSRAFTEWRIVDRDQRAFLRFGLRLARETYHRLWEEAVGEPAAADGAELFDERIDSLWPREYEWMHEAAVFRAAVTNFEVYLEGARAAVLESHGLEVSAPPRWTDLTALFDGLGVTIESGEVRRLRELRGVLTHQRGELRTDGQRARFAGDGPGDVVAMSEDGVVAAMDQLAGAVRAIDPSVWAYTGGGRRAASLVAADPG